jgi:hypothetical protein
MILKGMDEIAAYMRCDPMTIYRWERECGFPVGTLPDGTRISSSGLIDGWIVRITLEPPPKRLRTIERRLSGGDRFGHRDPEYGPPLRQRRNGPDRTANGEADADEVG